MARLHFLTLNLFAANPDVNIQDLDGWTALHAAAHWGQKEAAQLLADHFCNMDVKNYVVSITKELRYEPKRHQIGDKTFISQSILFCETRFAKIWCNLWPWRKTSLFQFFFLLFIFRFGKENIAGRRAIFNSLL